MMIRRLETLSVMTAAAGLAAAGCGGDEQIAGIDRGGAPVGVTASGPITGFGSVIVNGVRYDTGNAIITLDGQAGTEADLAVGQVVTVVGEIDGGVASAQTIEFDDNVEGPIASIDLSASQLIVLGQTVRVDAGTSFDADIVPDSLEGLAVGDLVEVSGLVDANGVIFATRIERTPAGGEFALTGRISAVDMANQRFEIGALTVDYSAAVLVGFGTGGPAAGHLVQVKGSGFGAGGELLATRVELETAGLPGAADDEAEVEGFVTLFVSGSSFEVAGQAVSTHAQTEFEGGTAADLALNVKVEVEGTLDANGVLVAEKVQFRQAAEVRITATVEAVDATAGTVTLLGITVTVNALTRMEDKSSADVEPFRLADVRAGDYLEVRGFESPAGSGQVTATLLEREDPDNEVELRGLVEGVVGVDFVILGVTIVTDATTVFRDIDGGLISAAEFFAQANGRLVEADGSLVGSLIVAAEVQLEN